MNKPKITIKVINKNGKAKRVVSRKRRRIFQFLKANNFQNCLMEVKVTDKDGYFNEGIYNNTRDTINALKDFLEVLI